MIPSAYPCAVSRYVKNVIKICEWGKNEKSALNLLCIALYVFTQTLTDLQHSYFISLLHA